MLQMPNSIDSKLNLALVITMGFLATLFVYYATQFGIRGFTLDISEETHLYTSGSITPNAAIFSHMLTGAVITLLAPLQLITPLRKRYPMLHRWTGYIFFSAALITAIAGLGFIVINRTIGGPVMDFAFALYGGCVFICSIQTVRYASARNFVKHREWALRIFVLAMGSWLYRMQYGVWFAVMGRRGIGENFTGPFDYFQDFAFFIPYLLGVEIYLHWQREGENFFPHAVSRTLKLASIAALLLGSYAFFPLFTG